LLKQEKTNPLGETISSATSSCSYTSIPFGCDDQHSTEDELNITERKKKGPDVSRAMVTGAVVTGLGGNDKSIAGDKKDAKTVYRTKSSLSTKSLRQRSLSGSLRKSGERISSSISTLRNSGHSHTDRRRNSAARTVRQLSNSFKRSFTEKTRNAKRVGDSSSSQASRVKAYLDRNESSTVDWRGPAAAKLKRNLDHSERSNSNDHLPSTTKVKKNLDRSASVPSAKVRRNSDCGERSISNAATPSVKVTKNLDRSASMPSAKVRRNSECSERSISNAHTTISSVKDRAGL
jgi:hypothetical protein